MAASVRWYVKGFTERSGIVIELDALNDIGRLSPDVETALFRVVQEGLTNVQRHSGSPTARIALTRSDHDAPNRSTRMQGDPDVIELLNEVLTAELTAINQYFVDAKMCRTGATSGSPSTFREESIDEMKDADVLIERILYLDGMPNLQRLGTVRVGETVPEKLELALELEREAIAAPEHAASRPASSAATTAPASCSTTSSKARRSTPTGSRRSSSSISQVGEAHYLAQQIRS